MCLRKQRLWPRSESKCSAAACGVAALSKDGASACAMLSSKAYKLFIKRYWRLSADFPRQIDIGNIFKYDFRATLVLLKEMLDRLLQLFSCLRLARSVGR